MRRPVIFGVPLTPSRLYEDLKSDIRGKNNIVPSFPVENPVNTGITRGVFHGKRIEATSGPLSLIDKSVLMYNAAIDRRQERALIDTQVGMEMRLKRKNGLGSGYNVPIQYKTNSKLRKNQYK
tara:strand:- start:234 stop:602 length:369 start_codon:yes stop_codon:yes gene_type:complete